MIENNVLEVVSIRLIKDAPIMSEKQIQNPLDAVRILGQYMNDLDREVICVVNLKSNGVPINCNFVSMGAVNETIAHPREVLKSSILSNAAAMIMIHNHPSGNLAPSAQDTMITDRMMKLCEQIDIPLQDHIIVGNNKEMYFSFREKGMLCFKKEKYINDFREINFSESAIKQSSTQVYNDLIVKEFKRRTFEKFHLINGTGPNEVETTIEKYIKEVLEENAVEAKILNMAITGSRARGLEKVDSDLDIVVEFETEVREDMLFNILNESAYRYCGVKVDINPIKANKSGEIGQYLIEAEKYLEQKEKTFKTEIIRSGRRK